MVATHTTSQLTPTKYHNHAHAVQVIIVANVGANKRRVREGTRTRLHKKPILVSGLVSIVVSER